LALMRELTCSTSLIVSLSSLSLEINVSDKCQVLKGFEGAYESSSRRTISWVSWIVASSLPLRKCDTSRVRPSLIRVCCAAMSSPVRYRILISFSLSLSFACSLFLSFEVPGFVGADVDARGEAKCLCQTHAPLTTLRRRLYL